MGPGLVSSALNNSIDNGKLERDYKCEITKILVKRKIYRKKSLAVLQYLCLSGTSTVNKMRNI